MAKDAVDAAAAALGRKAVCVSDRKPFPGGLPVEYEEYLKEALPELSSRHGVSEETVRHLVRFYGSGAERVLALADADAALGRAISPLSRDIYAQVLFSIIEEGARTLSDIVLRRMHLGLTGGRGRDRAEKIASLAAQEFKWSAEETRQQVENFYNDLDKDNECLR